MKPAILLGLAAALLAAAPGPRYLVVPGRSIGTIQLGADPVRALASLGTPSHAEGALGESWNTWLSKSPAGTTPNQLDVFWARPPGAAPNSQARTVQLIRVTSPAFQLANGLHVGSPFWEFAKAFPASDKVLSLQLGREEPRALHDDPAHGLAYELSRPARGKPATCVAIIVHPPGQSLAEHYQGLKSYLEHLAATK